MSNAGDTGKQGAVTKTVTELMFNFHEGLLSLVPIFENAKINLDNIEEFDEIDSITNDLFNLLVIRHIESVVKMKYNTEFAIAKYNFLHKDYTGISFIQAMPEMQEQGTLLAFISFNSKDDLFDTIYCHKIGYDGKILQKGVEIEVEGTQFRFVFRTPAGELAAFREIPLK